MINFYNREDPYYEFTNFHPCLVRIDGELWPTTEHYFQAQKFVGTPYVDTIRHLSRPRDAFQLSRDPTVSRWRRSDWEAVKENIMLKALRAKFSDQQLRLRSMLLGTGNRKLVEHTSNDSYWGDGGNGSGSNRLGHLLMQVRSELRGSGPRENGTGTVSAPGWTTLDDSAIKTDRRQGTCPPSGGSQLRRSNSVSSLSRASGQSYSGVSSSYRPVGELVTGRPQSYGRHSYPTPPQGHPHSHHHHRSTGFPSYAAKVKKGMSTVAKGAEKAFSQVGKAIAPPLQTHTHTTPHNTCSGGGNRSSVSYNIITHKSTPV